MLYQRVIIFIFTTLFLVAGCSTPTLFKQTEGNVATIGDKIKKADSKSDADAKPEPPLIIKQGMYVDKTPISLEKRPTWLKSHIVLRGDQLPFSFYTKNVIGNSSNVLVHYQPGLNATALISLNYSGDIKGALDLLAAKTGYTYTVHGNNLIWDAIISKTFDIAFMPGAVDYMVGDAASASSSSGAGGTATTAGGISSDSQYSNLKGSLSVWKDLEATVKTLLSPQGTVMVSQATTTLTVNDKPTNVDLVSKYIVNLNKNLARQVLVKVQILEINLTSDFNYGIDWSIVKRGFLGTNFQLNANYGTPVSITPFVSTPQIGFNGMQTGLNGTPQIGLLQSDPTHLTGVNALIQALEQQGKVSVVSEPRVVCLNNQVSEINIVDKQGYAASVSSTTFSGGTGVPGGSSVTSTITPGLLETGLVLYVLPKILNGRVFLQVNATLSSKVSIDSFTSGSGPGSASIQTPHTTQKQFNQRSVIGSGDTLILAGFRQVNNQTGAMQLFGQQVLGGKAAQQTMIETVILITPMILHGFI
jgi:type IVB pilus formation R64 PilN family outer membrane protein